MVDKAPGAGGSGPSIGDVLAYAEKQLGKPYVWGTAGPDTFDCSGLVSYVFGRYGVHLPHHAADQATYGSEVKPGSIKPGDLVFSNWGDGPDSHVGIAVSPSRIIDAPQPGQTVRYDNLTPSYLSRITSIRRIDSPLSTPAGGGGTGGGSSGGPGGLGTTGDRGIVDSLTSNFTGLLSKAEEIFSGPYREVAKPLQDIASSAVEAAKIGDKVLSAFMPSNFIRIASGLGGVALILIGLLFIAYEVRRS